MNKSLKLIIIVIIAIVIFIGIYIFSKKDNDPQVISLTIDGIQVSDATMNNHINIIGTINLSLDDKKYDGISLEGYCLDTDNKRYNIYGPQDRTTLYHNGSSEISLSEILNEDFGINWQTVIIKYCKINKMNAYKSNNGINSFAKLAETREFDLNYEKSFN